MVALSDEGENVAGSGPLVSLEAGRKNLVWAVSVVCKRASEDIEEIFAANTRGALITLFGPSVRRPRSPTQRQNNHDSACCEFSMEINAVSAPIKCVSHAMRARRTFTGRVKLAESLFWDLAHCF